MSSSDELIIGVSLPKTGRYANSAADRRKRAETFAARKRQLARDFRERSEVSVSDNPSTENSELGPAIDGVFMRATWVAIDPDPRSKNFAQAFSNAYGVEPEYHSAGGYACCQVLEQAVEATGNLDNERLRQTLLRRTFRTVMGELRFGENGLSSGAMKLCQWQDGKLEFVYPDSGRTAAAVI